MPRVTINLDRELYERLQAAVGTAEIESFIEEAVIERLEDFEYENAGSSYLNGEDSDGLEEFDDEEGEDYADDRD